MDLRGHTMLPGLIEMHVHLTSGGSYHGDDRVKLTDERQAILGVVHAKQTLMADFTTVKNVDAGSFGDVAPRNAINDGDISGRRTLVSGPPLQSNLHSNASSQMGKASNERLIERAQYTIVLNSSSTDTSRHSRIL